MAPANSGSETPCPVGASPAASARRGLLIVDDIRSCRQGPAPHHGERETSRVRGSGDCARRAYRQSKEHQFPT